jgi:hypothetical protein
MYIPNTCQVYHVHALVSSTGSCCYARAQRVFLRSILKNFFLIFLGLVFFLFGYVIIMRFSFQTAVMLQDLDKPDLLKCIPHKAVCSLGGGICYDPYHGHPDTVFNVRHPVETSKLIIASYVFSY